MVYYFWYICNFKFGNEGIEEKLSDFKVWNEVIVKYCVICLIFFENFEKNMNVFMFVKIIYLNIVLRM